MRAEGGIKISVWVWGKHEEWEVNWEHEGNEIFPYYLILCFLLEDLMQICMPFMHKQKYLTWNLCSSSFSCELFMSSQFKPTFFWLAAPLKQEAQAAGGWMPLLATRAVCLRREDSLTLTLNPSGLICTIHVHEIRIFHFQTVKQFMVGGWRRLRAQEELMVELEQITSQVLLIFFNV